MALRRRGEARAAVLHWVHQSALSVRPERPFRAERLGVLAGQAVERLRQAGRQRVAFRRPVAACQGRRAVDRSAVMWRQPEEHLPEASLHLQAAAWAWPAVSASVLRAQRPASVCQVPRVDPFGPARLAAQPPEVAAWRASALPSEPGCPDVQEVAQRQEAAESGPHAVPASAKEEAVRPGVRAQPLGVAALVRPSARPPGAAASVQPLAQQQVAAEAEPWARQRGAVVVAAQRASAASAEQPRAVALVGASAEQQQVEAAMPASVAVERLRVAARPDALLDLRQAGLPSLAAASTFLPRARP